MVIISPAVAAAASLGSDLITGNCTRRYTIREGDICDSISADHNVSTFQLLNVNKASVNPDCTNLIPGDELCLGIEGQDCSTVHIVQEGDTCIGVSTQAGIKLHALLKNNPQVNEECTNIYVGEVLCTLDKVVVPDEEAVPDGADGADAGDAEDGGDADESSDESDDEGDK